MAPLAGDTHTARLAVPWYRCAGCHKHHNSKQWAQAVAPRHPVRAQQPVGSAQVAVPEPAVLVVAPLILFPFSMFVFLLLLALGEQVNIRPFVGTVVVVVAAATATAATATATAAPTTATAAYTGANNDAERKPQ